ncbi:MAG TPA: permease prefix domain 1-containing protein, partial [Pyrinomonadaceae bacterium]
MKAVNRRLFKRFAGEQIKGEVEEELCFHLELLTEALLQQDMSPDEANAAALERFGNVEQIKDQCVEI